MSEPTLKPTRALLALGSNIEPRHKYLLSALQALRAHPNVRVLARSRIFESQSVEGGGESDFLNASLEIETSLSSRDLLALCQSIESTCGRAIPPACEHRSGARTLDVDILCFGDEVSDAPELTLPHPRALRRAFVLRPLLDLAEREESGWVRPTNLSWEED